MTRAEVVWAVALDHAEYAIAEISAAGHGHGYALGLAAAAEAIRGLPLANDIETEEKLYQALDSLLDNMQTACRRSLQPPYVQEWTEHLAVILRTARHGHENESQTGRL
jgi:hypothetical protein